jgi:hypothetical protein
MLTILDICLHNVYHIVNVLYRMPLSPSHSLQGKEGGCWKGLAWLSMLEDIGGSDLRFINIRKILLIDGVIQNIPLHVQIIFSHKGIYHFSIGSFPTHGLTIHAHFLIIPSYVLIIRAHVMMIPSCVKTTYIHAWTWWSLCSSAICC